MNKKLKRKLLVSWYTFAEKFRVTINGRVYGFTRVDDWEKRYGVEENEH